MTIIQTKITNISIKKRLITIKFSFFIMLFIIFFPLKSLADPPQQSLVPGEQLLERYCSTCHNLDYIQMQPRLPKKQTRLLWEKTVEKMVVSYGANIPTDLEKQAIIDYLVLKSQRVLDENDTFKTTADTSHRQKNFVPQENAE